ncbi:sensor histidine kinase [Actinospica robiniae]|uniref:sensor histidine kinase n=1 Tax=Actinospica robiniae TaxID=304901 RepID=UPI0004233B53|nr:sensor histidine kinase [Actinospica robiniae]
MNTQERERQMEATTKVLPYVALVVALGLALVTGSSSTGYRVAAVGLSAVAALWMALMHTPIRQRDERKVRGTVFYLGLLACIAGLILLNPFFAVFGWSGYLFVALVPGWWKLPAMIANAGLMAVSEVGGTAQLHGLVWIAYFGLFAVNTFIVGMLTKAGMDEELRNEQRIKEIGELSEANRRLAQTMEENAGLHAQLVVQAREAGIFDERQRMAGEIHDTLAQGLMGILAQLEAADLAEHDGPRRRRHLGLAKELARESLAEARRSVQALRPRQLEAARLPEALRDLAKQWTQTSGIPVRAEVDGEPSPLQPALEVVLFRAAQEALANTAKHAEAAHVGMTLTYMHDQVSLDVLDDGKGFDPDAVEPAPANGTGYGLSAMRHRLRQVGGSLEIESTPGDGTTVSASVPALYFHERNQGNEAGQA